MRFLILLLSVFATNFSSGQVISTVYGNGLPDNTGDGGPANVAAINYGSYIVFDRVGNAYISTNIVGNSIRKISTDGIITHFAGTTGVADYSGDGGPASIAKMKCPYIMVFDTAGDMYVSDFENHVIRKINMTTGIISTFAGTGVPGFSGDGGAATSAKLHYPSAMCFDHNGNLYIADRANYRIRKITPGGIISTYAGTGASGNTGDGGTAIAAKIIPNAQQMCMDVNDNLYIPCGGKIRKIDKASSIITTIAGTGTTGTTGDGGLAVNANIYASDLINDNENNLYFCGYGTHLIRKINTSGIISTIAGNGAVGFSGDGGPASAALLHYNAGMAFDSCGNLYVCDAGNYRIRKVTYNPHCWPLDVPDTKGKSELFVYPNPATATLRIKGAPANSTYVLYAVTGQVVATGMLLQRDTELDINYLAPGLYLLQLQDASGVRSAHKVVKE